VFDGIPEVLDAVFVAEYSGHCIFIMMLIDAVEL
jgi:hypothetical protein